MQTVAGTLLAIVNTMLFYHFLPPSGWDVEGLF
jgi:hypothetical protein